MQAYFEPGCDLYAGVGAALVSTLTAAGIDTVILTGLSTSGCARATCVACMSHGFLTIVVRDACGDRHPAPHEANLFDMHAKFVDAVDEAEAITYVQKGKNVLY